MASRLTSTAVQHVLASTRAPTQHARTAPCASPSARSVVQSTAHSTAASPRRPRPVLPALALASPMTTALRRNTVSTATRASAPGMKLLTEYAEQRQTHALRYFFPFAAAAVLPTAMSAQRQPQVITSSTKACANPRTRLSPKTALCGLTAATSAPASQTETDLFLPARGDFAQSWSCPSAGLGRLGPTLVGRGATVRKTSIATLRKMGPVKAFHLLARASSPPAPSEDEVVCGCDGREYISRCWASASAMNVLYEGKCKPEDSATTTTPASTRAECEVTPCNIRCAIGLKVDENGCQICECIDPCEDNPCQPRQECVIDPKECVTTPCPQYRCTDPSTSQAPGPATCLRSSGCDDGQYCAVKKGVCTGNRDNDNGMCADRPTFCPDVYLPQCSCDGITYGNDCEAAAAGANIAYEGECENPCANARCKPGAVCKPDFESCEGPDCYRCVKEDDGSVTEAPTCISNEDCAEDEYW